MIEERRGAEEAFLAHLALVGALRQVGSAPGGDASPSLRETGM